MIMMTTSDEDWNIQKNYVWCVNNKITGITIAIYYKESSAMKMATQNNDLFIKKMEIEY